jgi:hypothetical protein
MSDVPGFSRQTPVKVSESGNMRALKIAHISYYVHDNKGSYRNGPMTRQKIKPLILNKLISLPSGNSRKTGWNEVLYYVTQNKCSKNARYGALYYLDENKLHTGLSLLC